MEPAKNLPMSVSRLTVFFAIAGAIVGLASGVITSINIRLNLAMAILSVLMFYISYKLTDYNKVRNRFLANHAEGAKTIAKTNVIMTGFLPYFVVWLISWLLFYSLLL